MWFWTRVNCTPWWSKLDYSNIQNTDNNENRSHTSRLLSPVWQSIQICLLLVSRSSSSFFNFKWSYNYTRSINWMNIIGSNGTSKESPWNLLSNVYYLLLGTKIVRSMLENLSIKNTFIRLKNEQKKSREKKKTS